MTIKASSEILNQRTFKMNLVNAGMSKLKIYNDSNLVLEIKESETPNFLEHKKIKSHQWVEDTLFVYSKLLTLSLIHI